LRQKRLDRVHVPTKKIGTQASDQYTDGYRAQISALNAMFEVLETADNDDDYAKSKGNHSNKALVRQYKWCNLSDLVWYVWYVGHTGKVNRSDLDWHD
jgi:hypothetical protein